ncbi:XrtA/PEP-CTERM system histidine kinase PrsK [Alteromonas sp. 14N.309.X.WAT.G.H12]|uniref:XrtA/PEP-CTERM system histidine kinase PrsK n=1 Tax=Alteromonas sp. 14N.309.X.WAT.G.H12 TaxID=3120824 RepID=UPI002FD75792
MIALFTLSCAVIDAAVAASMLFIFTIKNQTASVNTHSGILFGGVFIWAVLYGILHLYFPNDLWLGAFGDIIKNGGIVYFVYKLSRHKINHPKFLSTATFLSLSIMVIAFFLPISADWRVTFYGMAGIAFCVTSLLFCERAYHVCIKADGNTDFHLIVGLTVIILVEFITYCDAIFSAHFKQGHVLLRMMAMLFAFPLIYKGINGLRKSPLRLSISRPLAFHGSIMFIVGSYLLAVSLLTTLSNYFNYQWDYTSKSILVGGLLFPISYIFLSRRIRSEIRVWVNKHFFASQFDYRRTWLELLDSLDPTLNGKEAADCGLKALLNILDHTRGAFFTVNPRRGNVTMKGTVNLHLNEASFYELESVVRQMSDEHTHWIIDVTELNHSPTTYPMLSNGTPNLLEDGVLWVIPVTKSNQIVAAIMIGKEEYAHWELNWETRDYLNALAQHLYRYYEAQMSHQNVNESSQLLAFSQTSAFVTHDMKNVYAQLSMITKNAKEHRDNPEFVNDVFNDLDGMERRMKKMLSQLTNKNRDNHTSNKQIIPVMQTIRRIVEDPASIKHNITPQITHAINGESAFFCDAGRFENVIRHLLDNAQQASINKEYPVVSVGCWNTEKNVIIKVTDNGVGMDDIFIRKRLFKPFDSTKGNAGMGLGVYDAKVFCEQHDGTINVNSEINVGTTIALTLPIRA